MRQEYEVIKPFKTQTRRYKAGTFVSDVEVDADGGLLKAEHWERRGFLKAVGAPTQPTQLATSSTTLAPVRR